MKKLKNILLISIPAMLLFASCETRTNEASDEEMSDASMEEIPADTAVNEQLNSYDEWFNSYVRSHPEISFYYIPSDTGEFKTVAGSYTVVVDNVGMVEDEDEAYKYFRLKYNERTRDRATFNEGIDEPAVPAEGYEEYLHRIDSALNMPEDRKGTVFVELVVGDDGEIDNAQIVDGVYGQDWSEEVESQVLEVVMDLDADWNPATRDGEPTSMRVEIPVNLSGDASEG